MPDGVVGTAEVPLVPERRDQSRDRFPVALVSVAIDAVYTWVNDRDPQWRESRDRFRDRESATASAGDPANAHDIRFTDNGELRYSLRSLDRYAGFFRRIYLVVDGLPPAWLDTRSSDVTVISHRDLFPPGFPLPVFSSDLIEAFLWRIPGLSEQYVYFNDDMLLGAPCTPSDFFDAQGRSIVRMEPGLIHAPRDAVNAVYNQMLRNTARAVARLRPRYRPRYATSRPWVPLRARQLFEHRLPLNAAMHIAQPFHRSVWSHFHEVFRDELAALSAERFRHRGGFCVNIAYQYLALQMEKAVFAFDSDELIVSRGAGQPALRQWQESMLAAEGRGVKFVCLNDGIGDPSVNWPAFVDETLKPVLGTPSRWELPATADHVSRQEGDSDV